MKRFANCELRIAIAMAIAALMQGCITNPQYPAATQPSTIAVPLATTQPSYWLSQPDNAQVKAADFQKLWTACEDVARDYLFRLDRQDYREGVLTTEPMVSGQWYEPWRRDEHTFYDLAEASFATMRRNIRFEFTREGDDLWRMSPKIVVERQSVMERRITSVVLYRVLFSQPREAMTSGPPGSREADAGITLPAKYWYPVRRDAEFEQVIAKAVQKKLGR
jgi:hypothetical protein